MTPKKRAAMQQAIEFIVDCEYGKAELALREALSEQAEQRSDSERMEPVAEVRVRSLRGNESAPKIDVEWLTRPTPGFLYAAPVRTKDHCNPLQDLTNDDIEAIRMGIIAYEPTGYGRVFARAVIAAYKEKNK